jgi:hypothetical protein
MNHRIFQRKSKMTRNPSGRSDVRVAKRVCNDLRIPIMLLLVLGIDETEI